MSVTASQQAVLTRFICLLAMVSGFCVAVLINEQRRTPELMMQASKLVLATWVFVPSRVKRCETMGNSRA